MLLGPSKLVKLYIALSLLASSLLKLRRSFTSISHLLISQHSQLELLASSACSDNTSYWCQVFPVTSGWFNPGTTLIYSLRGVSTTVLILPRTHARIVLKELKNKSKDASLDYFYMKILEIQTVASAYAREFNHTLNKQSILLPPISFPPVDTIDM